MAGVSRISRGDLAALFGVRLEDILRDAPERDVVVTDAQGHWAAAWIARVARTGIMDPFANHAFQPGNLITRADLAGAASRVMAVVAATRPELGSRLAERPQIADMAATHLSYPAVSITVALGSCHFWTEGGSWWRNRFRAPKRSRWSPACEHSRAPPADRRWSI